MDFIPQVMMVRHSGYDVVHIKHIYEQFCAAKKINKLSDRDVKVVGDQVYKIFHDGLPPHFFDVLHSGFFGIACPILSAIILDGEDWVGYITDKCHTLSVGPKDISVIRERLIQLYNTTGFVFNDFHSMNFGKSLRDITILDLESVTKDRKTKDRIYQEHIDRFPH